jgi:excinuclease ABC subunit A
MAGATKDRLLLVFDEPTVGLHFDDIKKLLACFQSLVGSGHTVLVVEHNLDVIKCADYVIDLGPGEGERGGEVVVAGTPEQVAANERSYTGRYLRGALNPE